MITMPIMAALTMAASLSPASGSKEANRPAWIETLRQTHARFTGRPGTFAQFGDSITVTQAYWSPLSGPRRGASPAMEQAFRTVQAYLRPECWGDWKGPEYGSESGRTSEWAAEHLPEWLHKLNPEVSLVMFGSNDLRDMSVEEYRRRMSAIVQQCLANGTFVILSTIPPQHGRETQAAEYAQVIRDLGREQKLPVIDFQAEILRRHPRDWDGALPQFASFQDYDVPTLISRDGLHPSFPTQYQQDYSEEGLSHSGYTLRSYLTLMTYARVVDALQQVRRDSSAVQPEAALSPPRQAWFPRAPRLPAPHGVVVRVSTVEELLSATRNARPGETILVADGVYQLPGRVEIRTDHLTLRGASGEPERVILDAGGRGEAVAITHCAGATIADLTVQNVRWNGIKLDSDTGVQQVRIYHCILHNIWQRAIKGVIVPPRDREKLRPRGCRVEYCLFYNDHAKRFEDDETDTPDTFGGNYIAGIDVMFARDWRISDNVFIGIQGRTREARGAVFLWQDAQDCIVERNVIIDCDSGICLGNSSHGQDVLIHCTGCVVRNNFITRAPEQGILADYTVRCKILNNTINDPQNRLRRLIRLVHTDDGLLVANNLLCGPPPDNESTSQVTFQNNLADVSPSVLVDPAAGDLRLTPRARAALGHAIPLPDVPDDIDHHPRGKRPDIGAHQLRPPAAASATDHRGTNTVASAKYRHTSRIEEARRRQAGLVSGQSKTVSAEQVLERLRNKHPVEG